MKNEANSRQFKEEKDSGPSYMYYISSSLTIIKTQ